MKVYLSIDRCPKHPNYYAVSVNDGPDGGGTRLTPTKCCGSWREVFGWWVEAAELVNEIECYADKKEPRT